MKARNRLLVIFLLVMMFCIVALGIRAQGGVVLKNGAKAFSKESLAKLASAGVIRSLYELEIQTVNNNNVLIVNGKPNVVNAKGQKVLSNLKEEKSKVKDAKRIVRTVPKPKSLITEQSLVIMMEMYIRKMKNRFLNYARISSQSVDTADMEAFPMTEGQTRMAGYLENELKEICKGSDAVITRSADQYVYVKIPSNMKGKSVPSVMFMAHLDVTPEAPGQNIKPIVHENYDGGNIQLPAGIVLSPETPQGAHLKNCKGMTIITSDGSTLLGADDKAGVTILVGLAELLVKNKKIKHGDVYMVFSQNEDIGRAAYRFESKYVDGSPDIVIDVDGNMPDRFSVENFTASMITYRFRGHDAHPGEGFVNKYGDALTAASYFIGQIDPAKHPSASKDKQGYIHCYSMVHPTDEAGKEISEDYLVKVRLRYFDKNEGDTLRQMLRDAERLAAEAYPFVKVEAGQETVQYENIAYTMYPGTADLIVKSAASAGMTMSPSSERGGTTSAMMAAKGLRGGPCIYSAQQAAHSVYEWVCVEDMVKMVLVTTDIVKNVAGMKKQ